MTGLADKLRALPVVGPGDDSLTRFDPFVEISVPLRNALADAVDALVWERECFRLWREGKPVRGLDETISSSEAALAAVARRLEDGAA